MLAAAMIIGSCAGSKTQDSGTTGFEIIAIPMIAVWELGKYVAKTGKQSFPYR